MNRVKQVLTRFATMFLALICVIGMGTPVFADFSSESTGSFKITDLDAGTNVQAYQIIIVNVDNPAAQPEYPMYTWAPAVQDWVRTNYSAYIGSDGDNTVQNVFANSDIMTAAAKTEFLEKMALAIKNGTIPLPPTQNQTAAKEGESESVSAVFSDMPMGEYLVTANGGVKVYSPTTVELTPSYSAEKGWILPDNLSVPMKSQDPSITKEVTSHTDQTVSIGDTVEYTLTVVIPDYPTDASKPILKVSDKLGTALTYGGNASVTLVDSTSPVVVDKDYIVTENPTYLTFEIVFEDSFVRAHGGEKMTISYTATVEDSATNTGDVLKNTATLTYSSNPYAEELKTKASSQNVYTYKTVISKYNSNGDFLPGAQFKLTKTVNNVPETMYFKAAITETTNTYTYNSSADSATNDYVDTLTVGKDGNLTIIGLDEGTYTLTETNASSEDYALPKGTITFTLANDNSNAAILGINTTVSTKSSDMLLYIDDSIPDDKGFSTYGDTLTIKVLNLKKDEANFTLPSTGGMGTLIFTVGGLFVMAGAVVLAVVMYKKKNA